MEYVRLCPPAVVELTSGPAFAATGARQRAARPLQREQLGFGHDFCLGQGKSKSPLFYESADAFLAGRRTSERKTRTSRRTLNVGRRCYIISRWTLNCQPQLLKRRRHFRLLQTAPEPPEVAHRIASHGPPPPRESPLARSTAATPSQLAGSRGQDEVLLHLDHDLIRWMLLSTDEETLLDSRPATSRPGSPLHRSLLSFVPHLRQVRGRPLVIGSFLLTILVYTSRLHAPPYPIGYTAQETVPAPRGASVHSSDSSLPEFSLPGGTRYPRPIPPSWPDPWPSSPRIAAEWLSSDRFPPPADVVGVGADTPAVRGRRSEVGLGTRPLADQFTVPEEHCSAAQEYFREIAAGWEELGLNEGESFDEDGRPRQVPRDSIYMGDESGWRPVRLGQTKDLPKIQQHAKDQRSKEETIQDSTRREWVTRAFLHLWEGQFLRPARTDEQLTDFGTFRRVQGTLVRRHHRQPICLTY